MSHSTQTLSPGANEVLTALTQALGEASVLTGDAVDEKQTADWSSSESAKPVAMVLPRTPAEVATTLKLCHEHGQPVSVQGGLTGLAGGANPHAGEIALSLTRLDQIEDIDELGGTLVAQAGVTLEALQQYVEARGWFFPLDLGARGSCQLGGNASTNAGGNRVLRYGMMRQLILGLEVVLADGTVLSMLDRVIKNNAGYDLKQFFIGTEGTLGVITRLALKLEPLPSASCTVLCAVPDFACAAELLRESRRHLSDISAFELMWDDFFQASLEAQKQRDPFADSHPLYVLMETLGHDREQSERGMEQFLVTMMERGFISDAVLAKTLDQAGQLWALREGVGELLGQMKPFIAFDVSVAMPRMANFVAQLRSELGQAFPQQQHLFFGHLGDGNLHLISGDCSSEAQVEAIEHFVYQHVHEVAGSISAEHGIGITKKPFLHYSRAPEQIELMRRLKQAFDPSQILNRDRLIPD